MIYLNNAATTYPKPKIVYETVDEVMKSHPYNITRSGIEQSEKDIVQEARKNLARLINADSPERLIFTSGATESLNVAIQGFAKEGMHIIASTQDHNASIRPLETLKKKGMLEVDYVPCDSSGFVDPNDIKKYIKRNTKAIVLNHVSNVTGTIQDAEAIGLIARDHDLKYFLDASQSMGVIQIDIAKLNADFIAFTGHKSLYGLQGIGGFYISKEFSLPSFKQGGTGTKSAYPLQPDELPQKFEAGTKNIVGVASLKAGTDWVFEKGLDEIRHHKTSLIDVCLNILNDAKRIRILRSKNHDSGQLISLDLPGIDPMDIHYILENSFEIQVRSGLHCAPLIHKYLGTQEGGTIRAGISYFTTKDEIESFAKAMLTIENEYGNF